jgi:hypothetical protein
LAIFVNLVDSHKVVIQTIPSPMRPVVFMHIQKTGGMSLATMMRRQFPRERILRVNGTLRFAAARLAAIPECRIAHLRFIYGHVPFGLHDYLPRSAAAYVTLLRNPVDPMVSIYYYALRRSEWALCGEIKRRRLSLRDFAMSDVAAEFNNGQTRMLSGAEDPIDFATALEKALENLNRYFLLAGLMERLDESVLLFRKLLGWRRVFYQKKNVNRHRIRLEDISGETLAAIERHNTFDLELYETACKHFNELLRQDLTVPNDLEQFRRFNAVYSMARNLFEIPHNLAARTGLIKEPLT